MQTKQATANHRPDTTGIPTNTRKIPGETRYIFAQTRTNYKSSLRKSRFHAPNNPMYSSNGLFLAQVWNTLLKSVNFKSAIGTGSLSLLSPCFFSWRGEEGGKSHFSSCDSAVYMPEPGIWTSLQRCHLQVKNCWEGKDAFLFQLASLLCNKYF